METPLGGDETIGPNPGAPQDPDEAMMQSRAIGDAQRNIKWLMDLLRPYEQEILVDAKGRRWDVLADRAGGGLEPAFPLQISYNPTTFKVTVLSGSVWWDGEDYIIEEWEETALPTDKLYVKIELEPKSVNIADDEDPEQYILDGYEHAPAAEPQLVLEKEYQAPVVDESTGGVTKNGIFSIYLGDMTETIQNRFGPLTLTACDDGSLSVGQPAFALYTFPPVEAET